MAYRRGDGAATDYEIAWVTVTPQHLRSGNDVWTRIDPVTDGCGPYSLAAAARAHGGARVPGRLGEVLLDIGHGASCFIPSVRSMTRRLPARTQAVRSAARLSGVTSDWTRLVRPVPARRAMARLVAEPRVLGWSSPSNAGDARLRRDQKA